MFLHNSLYFCVMYSDFMQFSLLNKGLPDCLAYISVYAAQRVVKEIFC